MVSLCFPVNYPGGAPTDPFVLFKSGTSSDPDFVESGMLQFVLRRNSNEKEHTKQNQTQTLLFQLLQTL